MGFIKNHFYRLTKELEKPQISFNPLYSNCYRGSGYTTTSLHSLGCETYWATNNQQFFLEPYKRFTVGKIYQASTAFSLYDDLGESFYLGDNSIACFEEIDVGLNDVSKNFIKKHQSNNKMRFYFGFSDGSMVFLKIVLNGKYNVFVNTLGATKNINSLLQNAYKELRKAYINKVKREINNKYTYIGKFKMII